MPSFGEQLSGLTRDYNASVEIHVANITATTQHPEVVGGDLPLFAIITGVLISFILIAVLIYTAVCSHCSSHHRLYSVSTRGGHPAHRLDTILHEDLHVSTVDYSTINNAFVDKIPQVHFHRPRDRTVSKSRSNLNQISEESIVNNIRWEKGISNAWYEATYDENSEVSDGQDEDEAMREVVSYRTWPLGSVEILEVIPEENEDALTQVNMSVTSSRRQNSQGESEIRQESGEESDQFYSCTEGDDDLGTTEANLNTTFTYSRHTTSPVHSQDSQREQYQELKRLLLEKISSLGSDVSRMGFTEPAESEEEEERNAVDGSGFLDRSRNQTGSARSLEAPSRAWRQSSHRATM